MKRTDGGLISTSFRTIGDVAVIRPRSLDDAVAALMQHPVPPAILAGGTDMVARFNEGFNPRRVLALADVGELSAIENDGENLRLGALVTHAQGSQSETVRRAAPGFAARLFENFPSHICDHLTSNDYLRDVGRTLLARQLTRLVRGGL
jgi:CO/xanthine dehydrogenase FAD-binding subunit